MSMLTKNEAKTLTYLQWYFLWPIITPLCGNDFSHYWPHPPIAVFVYSSWASFWTNSQDVHELACHDPHVVQLSVVRVIEVSNLARPEWHTALLLMKLLLYLSAAPMLLNLNPEQQIPCELGQGWPKQDTTSSMCVCVCVSGCYCILHDMIYLLLFILSWWLSIPHLEESKNFIYKLYVWFRSRKFRDLMKNTKW